MPTFGRLFFIMGAMFIVLGVFFVLVEAVS